MDYILIKKLKFYTTIGVYPEEQKEPRVLYLNLKISTDFSKAAKTDNLADTIDYAILADYIAEISNNQKFNLLEALAEYLAQKILAKFKINFIELEIIKPKILPSAKSVSVIINRHAEY